MDTSTLYPNPSRGELKKHFVGKKLEDLPCPMAVIDRHIAARNCRKMSEACKELNVLFRAHIKTSKEGEKHVRFIVSTVAEAEFLKEYLLDVKKEGRNVNVLYGFPIAPSLVERLAKLAKVLGVGSITLLVDNLAHIESLRRFKEIAGFGPDIMFKVDAGYGRAGIPPTEDELGELAAAAVLAETEDCCSIKGVYSHSGHSYSGESAEDGMKYLLDESKEIAKAAAMVQKKLEIIAHRGLIASVGASPSATSVRNLLGPENATNTSEVARNLRITFKEIFNQGISIELHAGVYSLLDIQQLNIQSTPSSNDDSDPSSLTTSDLALSVLAEVASVYPKRNPPQALIGAGILALGREPCPGYSSWAVVSGWGLADAASATTQFSGWEVNKISQEHGLLFPSKDSRVKSICSRQGVLDLQDNMPFEVGQKIRLWPNHACITAACYGFFAVVDSSSGRGEEVVDVWIRCRGW